MKAYEIEMFRQRLAEDPENLNIRRTMHEHYEWLDSYWKERYGDANQIDKFCGEFEKFYWECAEIKEVARKLSFYSPVGSSSYNFEPSVQIQRATYFLKHKSNLVEGGFPKDEGEEVLANQWQKSSFNALLTIVKQIRDNLFHGQKMDLEETQYKRNKELITMAASLTTVVLNKLVQAEQSK